MVQIIDVGNPQGKLSEMLGMSLGQGIGNGLNTYFANRSLESVLHDKALKNAPPSQKLEALRSALSPYGEKGQEILNQRVQIEQQAMNEAQSKIKGRAIGKLARGENISDEEWSRFTPQEVASLQKAYHPTATQASQPINPDQLNRIQQVRKSPEYENASPSKKYQLLTDNGVSKENAEAESKIAAEEEKNKPGGEFGKLREKAVADYVTQGIEKKQQAEELKYTIDTAKKAINGQIQGPGILGVLKNDPYGQIFLGMTPDEAALTAANKKMLEGTKGIFGSKPTEKEIFLLLNSMLPSIGKTREANLAGLAVIEKANDLALLHSDLIDEITEGGSKYIPNVESQVNNRMKPIIDQFRKELMEVNEKFSSEKSSTGSKRVSVYDSSGKKVGDVDQGQVNQLPKGYIAK